MSSSSPSGAPSRPRYDVITFGETMIRFSPVDGEMLEQADYLRADAAGTESNMAAALARMGADVAWVSVLPDHPAGRWIASRLALHGVDTSHVAWSDGRPEQPSRPSRPKRTGVFFLEPGSPPRGSRVVYDRAGSAATGMTPAVVEQALQSGARIVHTSGITASLSSECRETVARVLDHRAEGGYRTSFDINYRAKLWSPEEACAVLETMLGEVDILVSTTDDAALIFGMDGTPEETVEALHGRFGNEVVVLTLAEGGAVGWSAATGFLYTQPYVVEPVDRLGAGDAFDAGLLYGLLREDLATGLSYGTALSALCLSERGDMTWSTLEEVKQMARPVHASRSADS
ncbi:MAG: sugar kinase [Gemmatimonadetes bacterium]|nr:sugar kinase [Gemmatimonadota bacterium]MYH20078.1 sugar kinase [Gemmatimonadota bacterium]MYK98141.1 sugar kinase [Gemmatimonadota bacterium]